MYGSLLKRNPGFLPGLNQHNYFTYFFGGCTPTIIIMVLGDCML